MTTKMKVALKNFLIVLLTFGVIAVGVMLTPVCGDDEVMVRGLLWFVCVTDRQ